MKYLRERYRAFCQDAKAVTSIEYALLASLIAMVVVTSITSLGGALMSLWGWVAGCVVNLACT